MRAGTITCYPCLQVLCILKIFPRRLFETVEDVELHSTVTRVRQFVSLTVPDSAHDLTSLPVCSMKVSMKPVKVRDCSRKASE
jgi:hypothetical protein